MKNFFNKLPNPRQFSRRTKIILSIVLALVVIRAALPFGVQAYVNHVLAENPDYDGKIGDVDLHILRGAYSIHDINIQKKQGKELVPFFQNKALYLSVGWAELLQGYVSSSVRFIHPQITLYDSKEPPKPEKKEKSPEMHQALRRLVPFKINRLTIVDGAVRFKNVDAKPPVDIVVNNIEVDARNLTNKGKSKEARFASADIKAKVMESGNLTMAVAMDPLSKKPSFDVKGKLLDLDLKKLNPLMRKYANLDFEQGRGEIVIDVEANNGQLDGYVKPLFKQMKILSLKNDDDGGLLKLAWEGLAEAVTQLFRNQPKDQLATKIPIDGNVKNPDMPVFVIIGNVLQNAFFQAFTPFYEKKS